MSRRPDPGVHLGFDPEIERIAQVMELAEGFVLQPIVVPHHDVADALVDGLRARGIAVDVLSLDSDAAWSRLLGALVAGAAGQATLVYTESLGPASPGALRQFNLKRDRIAADHPRPLLWVTTPALDRLLWEHAPDLWSIAAVPIRLVEVAPTELAADPDEALIQLLRGLFNADELRRFVQSRVPELTGSLPGPPGSFAALVEAFVGAAVDAGLVGDALFRALLDERPRRRASIAEVAGRWGLALPPEEEAMPGDRHGDPSIAAILARGDLRGPLGTVRVVALTLRSGGAGVGLLGHLRQHLRQQVTREGGALLVLAARASDDSLARTPVAWRQRLREAVGASLQQWLGGKRWLIVAVVDPAAPGVFCDPAEFSGAEAFAGFFSEVLTRDLGEHSLRYLAITLLVRSPGRVRRALAQRLGSRLSLEAVSVAIDGV